MLYEGQGTAGGNRPRDQAHADPIVRQFIEGRPNLDDEGPEHVTAERRIQEPEVDRRSGVERRT